MWYYFCIKAFFEIFSNDNINYENFTIRNNFTTVSS